MPACALCLFEGRPPRHVQNPIGLLTARPEVLAAATHAYGNVEQETHVLVPVCPEHVVDIYRGRVPGIRMAWRLGPNDQGSPTASPAGREGASAFQA
jgi:hypothetical protein